MSISKNVIVSRLRCLRRQRRYCGLAQRAGQCSVASSHINTHFLLLGRLNEDKDHIVANAVCSKSDGICEVFDFSRAENLADATCSGGDAFGIAARRRRDEKTQGHSKTQTMSQKRRMTNRHKMGGGGGKHLTTDDDKFEHFPEAITEAKRSVSSL